MNSYLVFIIIVQIHSVFSEEFDFNNTKLTRYNQNLIPQNHGNATFFFLNDFRRKSKILNHGNVDNRRFFTQNVKTSKIYDVENIATIVNYIAPGKPIVLLLHDDDNNNRDVYITKLINKSKEQHNILLMKFNNTGVTSILESTNNNLERFNELLLHNSNTKNYIGSEMNLNKSGGVVFFSMLKASRSLPEDAAIVIFTSGQIEDEDIAQLALQEISSKNIKTFLVWESEYPTKNHNERLIEEVINISNGLMFVKNQKQNQRLYSASNNWNNMAMSLILSRTNLMHENALSFPVDTGATELQIRTSKEIEECALTSYEYNINLLNIKNGSKFMDSDIYIEKTHEIVYRIAKPATGIWVLRTKGKFSFKYNVSILIQNDFFVNTQIIKQLQNKDDKFHKENSNLLKLDVHGLYKKIDSVTFLNENGEECNKEELYHLQETEQINENETEKELNINIKNIPNDTVYIKTSGQDNNGKPFVRLSYVNRDPYNRRLQPLSIEIGEGSELLTIPNQSANIYFKIRNNRDQELFLEFHCKSSRPILHSLNPQIAWISPRQTITVVLNVQLVPKAGVNYRDEIVFRSTGPYTLVEKSTYIYVHDATPLDNLSPHMWHTYTKYCTILSKCEEQDWNIEVTAQDSETGLRELTSIPRGLYFPNGYISGTKEPVIGYYTGSCCNPKLQLIATDLKNNKRSYTADAYQAQLGPGAIAAIVLSILIILAIIIAVIIFCKCRKKESGSFDLPTYRSPTRRYD